jgi:glycosyltransferase involved in cell wall biosynthesis
MRPLRVFQVITRMARGGAQAIVLQLLERLPRMEFEQTLVCGGESPIPAIVIPDLVREVRPAADFRAAARLACLFAIRRPDVVHAHTYKAGVLASVAGRLTGVPVVIFTPHGHIFARGARIPGVPESGWKLAALRWITRAAQACAQRVTALSDADLREQLALELSPPSKYVVVRNGIDVERFAARAGGRRFEGSPVIGAVGRFSSEKGHRYLVDALARVRLKLPRARLVLVGYGELEGDLRRQVERLFLEEAVTFAGERDSAEALSSFDVFAQPSLYESQGLAILEAMAAAVPVVATKVGGVGDVVQEEETGLLVPPADPDGLAAAIIRLAGEPEFTARLAMRGQLRVRELFSSGEMVTAYGRLYKQTWDRYNSRPCTTT